MSNRINACAVPAGSGIYAQLPGADFVDAHQVSVDDGERSALGHFLILMNSMPRWIDNLMVLRNRLVRLCGLKDLGRLSRIDLQRDESTYRANERVGIFTLLSNSPDEVLLVDRDKHLDVYIALQRRPLGADNRREIVVSTVVHTHNRLGRLYMLPVAPFHRFIAPIALKGLIHAK
ncbi:DUF2867 domain-containing protein [Pseudomonas rubra]|uniref:DUF2867 domain-containing protein n=1 Tax=Pseudomonas rubra TaxID=2942627 RepID=A0ABT5PFS1_9PSED|nr:DUF2867 domain-containing protein [Pseudomonas rubra]MDD1017047.1 DUF2867 domain-containing protein [Pseudomonas rubra]MDD1037106.1 DUF2867 domain-containing protein [Pseudomonas rubra]MDD1153767.1 DUF2867 domain-containing protein [Pseudomonas rubra]